jgi:hypothetical protein
MACYVTVLRHEGYLGIRRQPQGQGVAKVVIHELVLAVVRNQINQLHAWPEKMGTEKEMKKEKEKENAQGRKGARRKGKGKKEI